MRDTSKVQLLSVIAFARAAGFGFKMRPTGIPYFQAKEMVEFNKMVDWHNNNFQIKLTSYKPLWPSVKAVGLNPHDNVDYARGVEILRGAYCYKLVDQAKIKWARKQKRFVIEDLRVRFVGEPIWAD